MNAPTSFVYQPSEHEAEKASTSYLMSLVVLIVGVPLPIINLVASVFFLISNQKGTYFVRWHCMQALLSQVAVFVFNSFLFWWTVSILFFDANTTPFYAVYLTFVVVLNLIEFFFTMYAAIETRKGKHVFWPLFGDLTQKWVKP